MRNLESIKLKNAMKQNQDKSNPPAADKSRDPARGKTNVPGQNPKQNDAPDHDEHHDESRVNQYTEKKGEQKS